MPFYVYIMASPSRVLYTGVTNNLDRRVMEHKQKQIKGFTEKYGVRKLVYYEIFTDPRRAISREKQIKRWRREKKTALVEAANAGWTDISADWFCVQALEGESDSSARTKRPRSE